MTYWREFLTIALAHALAVASPGPDFALVLRQSLAHGRRTAIWSSIGIGCGLSVHIAYCILGLGYFLKKTPAALATVQYLGAAYLAWVGVQALRARARTGDVDLVASGAPNDRAAWTTGFVVNLLNPKAALFFISLFALAVDASTPKLIQAGYGLWMTAATIGWFVFVSTVFTQLNQYRIILEVDPHDRQDASALDRLYVRGSQGAVPLSSFVRVEQRQAPLSFQHQGQFPSVTLSFNTAPGVSLGDAVAAVERTRQELGTPPAMRAEFTGAAAVFRSSLASEPLLVLAALITVYIVLGVLYESYIHPVTILSTLPSAGVGAILALYVVGKPFDVIALIGIVLLIGIVKKNAIMMIDFALEAEREQKCSPEESIYKACLLRFRPIMMTTMAALLGGLPLALGSGTGAELRRPLGITIVGGLLVSQVLTLYTTPVIYLFMDKLGRRKKPEAGAP